YYLASMLAMGNEFPAFTVPTFSATIAKHGVEDFISTAGILAFKTAESSLRLEEVSFHESRTTLLSDVLTGKPQPFLLAG
ncbi:hypothetical protein XENOCAPTIV_015771, partial [Xenoophorus captivus]